MPSPLSIGRFGRSPLCNFRFEADSLVSSVFSLTQHLHIILMMAEQGRDKEDATVTAPAVSQGKNQPRDNELSVLRLSQKDTWRQLKIQRKSSFSGDDGQSSVTNEEAPSRRRQSWRRNGCEKGGSVYIVDNETSVVDAILSQDRLNALLACDIGCMHYDPNTWSVVLTLRGRNIQMIAIPLILLTIWSIFWIVLLSYDQFQNMRDTIGELDGLISPLLVPVSFLLVFRLGRAAVRFWDARTAVGKIVEICRAFISTAAVTCGGDGDHTIVEMDALVDDIAALTALFPISVKNFLQPSTRKGWNTEDLLKKRRFEIGSLLLDEDANAVLNASDTNTGPIIVLNKLRKLVWKLTMSRAEKIHIDGPRDMLYQQLNVHLDTLTGAWGACERINSTPLPLVYVVHLRTFLLLYLILWQMEAAANHGWVAFPTVFAASWGLLGIEAAAVECERPFKWRSNHLPLGGMCVVVSRGIAQTLNNSRSN